MSSKIIINPFSSPGSQEQPDRPRKFQEESDPGRRKRKLDEQNSEDAVLYEKNELFSITSQDLLCDQCRNMDLTDIFDPQVVRPTGRPIRDLTWIKKERTWLPCPMCRLFLEVTPSYIRPLPLHVRAFSGLRILTKKTSRKKKYDCALGVLLSNPKDRVHTEWISYCRDQGFIVPEYSSMSSSLPESLYRGCRLEATQVNYERFQEWLSRCARFHSNTCSYRGKKRLVLTRCIDCYSREVVPVSRQDRYLALSYVWGTLISSKAENSANYLTLPLSGVSRVVEDAMTVVKCLGERYLWVDKYCIEKLDKKAQNDQISNMDSIYEGAYATVVACAGSDASFGLPGVSTPRKRQPSVRVGNQLLVSTLPQLSSVLEKTVWATRAWTYQEAILSRRCLFFTEFQVYFLCAAMTCCEAVVSGEDDTTLSSTISGGMHTAELFRTGWAVNEKKKDRLKIQDFTEHISRYSYRNLTYSKDALDAFRGLLSRSQFWSYYGIPIAPQYSLDSFKNCQEMDLAFAQGLHWLPDHKSPHLEGNLSRRLQFPSWSWVGWEGPITYRHTSLQNGSTESLITANGSGVDSQFWLQDTKGIHIKLWELYICSPETKLIPEISEYLIMQAFTIRLRFQRSRNHQIKEFCVCKCHPDTQHSVHLNVMFDETWGVLSLCEIHLNDDTFLDRLASEVWTCILLFNGLTKDEYSHNLLVIDWNGEVAHRIGALTLKCDISLFGTLYKTRCTILLE